MSNGNSAAEAGPARVKATPTPSSDAMAFWFSRFGENGRFKDCTRIAGDVWTSEGEGEGQRILGEHNKVAVAIAIAGLCLSPIHWHFQTVSWIE